MQHLKMLAEVMAVQAGEGKSIAEVMEGGVSTLLLGAGMHGAALKFGAAKLATGGMPFAETVARDADKSELETVIKRFDALHPDEINSAYKMPGDELNKKFNVAQDEVQRLMREGRTISDPELSKAQQQASLQYHQLELKEAYKPQALVNKK